LSHFCDLRPQNAADVEISFLILLVGAKQRLRSNEAHQKGKNLVEATAQLACLSAATGGRAFRIGRDWTGKYYDASSREGAGRSPVNNASRGFMACSSMRVVFNCRKNGLGNGAQGCFLPKGHRIDSLGQLRSRWVLLGHEMPPYLAVAAGLPLPRTARCCEPSEGLSEMRSCSRTWPVATGVTNGRRWAGFPPISAESVRSRLGARRKAARK